MKIKNKVQLITYPNSLGNNISELHQILNTYFPNVFEGGIHLLPPFPSSGDRGFAPITYFEIEPNFGTWKDIQELGKDYDIMLDVMVNHISQKSSYFQDFLKYGKDSKYYDMFISIHKLWEDGNINQEDIDKMFLRREQPYSTFTIENSNQEETVWTTFGKETPSEQIDIDIHSSLAKDLIKEILHFFSENHIHMVRLDAVGYVTKKLGTDCFFVEPEIYQFLDWVIQEAKHQGIVLLPEVHAKYQTQYQLAKHSEWIYDFILPYRILEALLGHTSKKLVEYLNTRPSNQFTMLDCHDGVPVKPDLDGLITSKESKMIVDTCIERGANLSKIHSKKYIDEDGFDVHQIRGTFYSLLDNDDQAYLTARAIQFFTPGIPQVYYVGLLAGKNDIDNPESITDGRAINRHNYSILEIKEALEQGVVQKLIDLIKFRNTYPAFNGECKIESHSSKELQIHWKQGLYQCTLVVDFTTNSSYIDSSDQKRIYF